MWNNISVVEEDDDIDKVYGYVYAYRQSSAGSSSYINVGKKYLEDVDIPPTQFLGYDLGNSISYPHTNLKMYYRGEFKIEDDGVTQTYPPFASNIF